MDEELFLSLFTSGGRVTTVGLHYLDHRELSMRAVTPEAARRAESVLPALAAHVARTRCQIRPGDAFALSGGVVRVEPCGPDHLEVVPCEPGWLARHGLADDGWNEAPRFPTAPRAGSS
jgi:hypothetical protein